MNESKEDRSITEYLRAVLLQGSRQGRKYGPTTLWPTIAQYARWIGCSPQLLHRFAHGKVRALGQEKLDALAYLTGAFPRASPQERLNRLREADAWLRDRRQNEDGASLFEFLRRQDTDASGSADR